VLDPDRAVVFEPWVAFQVTRHVANTRAGQDARISEDVRRRFGDRAPLWARGRTLGGYAHYPESGLDQDTVCDTIVAAALEAAVTGRSPGFATLNREQMAAAFTDGWAAGLRVPQYPLPDGDHRLVDSDGIRHSPLPTVERMRREATTWRMRSWDGQSDGDRLVDHYGHEIRWLADASTWAYYDGIGWSMAGAATQVLNRARRMVDALPHTEALGYEGAPEGGRTVPTAEDESPWAGFIRFVHGRRNQAAHDAMIKQAAGSNRVTVLRDAFDPDPWLLNVGNGVLDLRTAELRDRDPALLLMQRTPVAYDPAARCPAWETFLAEALCDADGRPDVEVHRYLQRAVGYTLTGRVDEHTMLIHYGRALDARRVFTDVLRALFGDYAQTVPRGTLTVRRNETSVPNDLARMVGKRLLVASEPANGGQLDDEMVTDIVGGQPVPARHMRAEWFEFRPVGKVHMFAEHMPTLTGGPEAAEKLHLIEWATLVSRARCKVLSRALSVELPGILAWAVGGALVWQQSGLEPPQAVRDRTAEHLFHGDVLAQWVDDRLDCTDVGVVTETRELYPDYAARAERAGEVPLSEKAFSIALVERHKLRRGQHSQTRRSAFFGVGFRADVHPDSGPLSVPRLRRVR